MPETVLRICLFYIHFLRQSLHIVLSFQEVIYVELKQPRFTCLYFTSTGIKDLHNQHFQYDLKTCFFEY